MMAQYTSGQYKWMLYQRLRQAFSMKTPSERAYTQTFFLELFDGITVTEADYVRFTSMMDRELDHLAELGVYNCEEIPQSEVESGSLLLIEAFAQIGIGLEIDSNDPSYYLAIFTKPGGTTLTYKVGKLGTSNYFFVNARAGTEYRYARLSAPAYDVTRDAQDVDVLNPRVAGPGTWWDYSAQGNGAMTISGSGSYAGATTDEQLGSGAFATLIIGADVSRLLGICLVSNETVMVLLHPADGTITIDENFNSKGGSCSTQNLPLDVYTDCAAAIETLSGPDFAEKITLHPLSEWEG